MGPEFRFGSELSGVEIGSLCRGDLLDVDLTIIREHFRGISGLEEEDKYP